MRDRIFTAGFALLVMMSYGVSAKPPTDGIYPEVHDHPIPDDISGFKQPASLIADLKAIQTGSLDERLKALAEKSLRDQVFVKGGDFLMGDFGTLQSKEKLPYSGHADSQPLHQVTLDSYSISKYKVTIAEFDVYSEANRLPKILMDDIYTKEISNIFPPWRGPDKPAGATWDQAKTYCQWLGIITRQPFDLPTEAQWEYAARDRGRFILWPTNNGKLDWNVNVPSPDMIEDKISPHSSGPFHIALFPPNQLGLYDLAINSMDWVKDWYSPKYYEHSVKQKNPTGPAEGNEKVARSWPITNDEAGMSIYRRKHVPHADENVPFPDTRLYGFRCSINGIVSAN